MEGKGQAAIAEVTFNTVENDDDVPLSEKEKALTETVIITVHCFLYFK